MSERTRAAITAFIKAIADDSADDHKAMEAALAAADAASLQGAEEVVQRLRDIASDEGTTEYAWRVLTAATALLAELRVALEPLARLELPKKPQGNAGFYSIRHDDIRRARALLAKT